MSVCSRSDNNKSKSDRGVRSGISIKNHVHISVQSIRNKHVLDQVSVLTIILIQCVDQKSTVNQISVLNQVSVLGITRIKLISVCSKSDINSR